MLRPKLRAIRSGTVKLALRGNSAARKAYQGKKSTRAIPRIILRSPSVNATSGINNRLMATMDIRSIQLGYIGFDVLPRSKR